MVRYTISLFITIMVINIVYFTPKAFSAVVEYDFEGSDISFKVVFDKGYSNVFSYEDNELKVVSFDTTEALVFERQDFFDSPVVSVWSSSEGSRKKLFFLFENNKIIDPVITKNDKSLVLDFIIPDGAYKKDPLSPGAGAYLRMTLGLGIIIAIIAGSFILMKFFFKNNLVSDIPGAGRLLGKVNLDVKKQLIFYELGEVIYIIAANENGISLLDKVSEPTEITTIKSGFSKRKNFGSYMKIFTGKGHISEDLHSSSNSIKEKLTSLKEKNR